MTDYIANRSLMCMRKKEIQTTACSFYPMYFEWSDGNVPYFYGKIRNFPHSYGINGHPILEGTGVPHGLFHTE